MVRRREDGYHEIASLFGAISLFDSLHIERSSKDRFTCSDATLPLGQENLVIKARDLFRKRCGIVEPVDIDLKKRIPQGAGLGGGSSNAATTLFGLNELFERPFSLGELTCLGAALGSDVPFFFSSGLAYCTGRGELMENVAPIPLPPLMIAKPPEALSTPLVYQHTNVQALPQRDPRSILRSFQEGCFSFFNDLEPAAFLLLPKLKLFKEKLLASGFSSVCMTGSGTAFFCLGRERSPLPEEGLFFPACLIPKQPCSWWLEET